MNKDGFIITCNHCNNQVVIKDKFIRSKETIYFGTWMSLDITCEKCDNSINESDED
jgi:hypothetical protein